MNLLSVGRRLVAQGVECLASLHETRFAPEFAIAGIPVLQAFVWPTRRFGEASWTERPIGALSDVLGNLGFADPDTLGAAIAHYDALLTLFRPDVVLAENAFGAVAGARGRLPCIAFGTAACLPPLTGKGFAPRFDGPAGPTWPLDELRARMNVAFARSGRPPVGAVNALLAEAETLPYGPVAFDIYGPSRVGPILPPNIPDLPRPVPVGDGDRLFAYLHGQVQHFPAVLDALCAMGSLPGAPPAIHMPGMAPATHARLDAAGWSIRTQAMPIREILATSGCVLHHGGTQLTAACLAAAIPQVLLPKEIDNEIAAHFLATQGLGFARYLAKADSTWLTDAVRRALGDAALRGRCRARADLFRHWVAGDPAEIVAARALTLMNGRRATSRSPRTPPSIPPEPDGPPASAAGPRRSR